MAQASPSDILYAQAALALVQLKRDYAVRKYRAPEEVTTLINKALTDFEERAGGAITKFEPIELSEVPNSAKMNRFWTSFQNDINLLQKQVDTLRAAAIDTHNHVEMEIKKAKNNNLALQNKLKTLEMYSNVDNNSQVRMGDTFITEDLIDWNAISSGENRATVIGKQYIGLGFQAQESALEEDPTVIVLEGSNGFLGNNQEVRDPDKESVTNPANGEKRYYFKSSVYPANELGATIDSQPATWIEFEKYKVKDSDRAKARDYGFRYELVNDPKWNYLKSLPNDGGMIDWADGLAGEPLILNVEVDLKTLKKANVIKLLPFTLADNANNPILIKNVTVSADKTVWDTLGPENLWIASGIDKRITEISDANVVIGEASWTYSGDPIRYVRFTIHQPKPIQVDIGHHYYYSDQTENPDAPERLDGPNPPVNNTRAYHNVANSKVGDLIQRTEYFTGERWAIGVRDISVFSNRYHTSGVFVSNKFNVPGIVDRVSLSADVIIPSDWDQSTPWIEFYVSPNNGKNWYQISRVQDDFLDIPEIIAFNDPTPLELREPGVKYYDVNEKVDSLRLKVKLSRPEGDPYATPILKPYTLKVIKRV